MNRNEVIHKELIIDECHVTTMESLLNLINRLNQAPELYEKLKAKQQAVLQDLFFDKPLLSLETASREKEYRNTATVHMVAQIIRPPLFLPPKLPW